MPDPTASRLSAGADLLLDQLRAEGARIADLRRAAEAAETTRLRLEAALDALAPTLPPERADALRREIVRLRRQTAPLPVTPRDAPQAELMALLAAWERPVIAVAEAQEHVLARGFPLNRVWAAGSLDRLAARGVVHKAGRGRYRILRTHPDLIALRLAALEKEIGEL